MNFNKVTAIFGMRGTGKTTYLMGDEKVNIPGIFDFYLTQKKMKILIIDTIDHPSYRHIPVITLKELKTWEKGIARIWLPRASMPKFYLYLNTLTSIWNTYLIFEDAYKHIKDRVDDDLIQLIIDSKQKNIDITFMYHAWGWAPKDLYKCLELIEVFKTLDSPKNRKDDMPGYYDIALRVYQEVNANPSKFFHKLINTGV